MAAILFSEEIEGDEFEVVVATCGACSRWGIPNRLREVKAIGTRAELRALGWKWQQNDQGNGAAAK